ncbi:MAG: NADH-quinone oxidoreductase subunit M [Gammaproteobacteria bacterium]|nr:NADH-quinone oxidoreductase subunit M [Gammaproteobacteria bacterium]
MHDLTLLLLLPVIGAVLIALVPAQQVNTVRRLALVTSGVALLKTCLIAYAFDASSALFQFSEETVWNARLGTSYALAIDAISLSMILLAALLTLIATMASASIKTNVKAYYILLLLLESAMLGVFMARDWSLFYVFWELTLIPLFFLIDRWGGKNRHGAALNFVLYTMGGSVFMLLSLLVLFDTTPHHSFAMADMLASGHTLSADTQLIIFLGFLLGFGVKMPIFPLHGWLPLAHVEAPSAVSILLSGVLLKMGAYGLIRSASMLPDAVIALQPVLAALALFSLIYGGLLAWRQSDLKAMIAYSSISHMGVVLLGIAALNVAGLTGAVMQMVAHGLVAGATFLLIGLLYERTHTRDINHYCSLVRVNPRFAFFTTLAFFAVVGMPGTAGFIAELHVIIGGFEHWRWAMIILSLGVMISAAYAIRTIGRLFTGPVHCEMKQIQDLRTTEMIAASILTLGFLILGFYPTPALDLISTSVHEISSLFATRL